MLAPDVMSGGHWVVKLIERIEKLEAEVEKIKAAQSRRTIATKLGLRR